MARISRTKVGAIARVSAGAQLAAVGRKGGKGAMPAQSDGFGALNPFVGTKTIPTSASKIAYGTSSPTHLTLAQSVDQVVTSGGHTGGPLNADHIRISQSSEPAAWSNTGKANQIASAYPTLAFCYSFKVASLSAASAAAVESASFGSGNAFYDKWFIIFRDQVPDVQKKDKRGNVVLDQVAAQHEPFGDAGWTGPVWSQLQRNLCHIVRNANLARTNKLRVAAIYNGHDAAMAAFDDYYPTAMLTTYKPELIIGVDCYDYMNTNGTIDGIYQYVRAHDFAKARGYAAQWTVPELGVIIGSATGRPTDAVALQMVKDVETQNLTWPAAEHPIAIDWFNNGGQGFDGTDDETSNPANVPLPQTLAEWSLLAHQQITQGLVPSTHLTPSATLVPSGG